MHRQALRLLQQFGQDRPPIDVQGMAIALQLDIQDIASSTTSAELHFQRFLIAHQIGHHSLQTTCRGYQNRCPEEIEANWFAADLLMPVMLYAAYCDHYGAQVAKLAEIFKVSRAAAETRMGYLAGVR